MNKRISNPYSRRKFLKNSGKAGAIMCANIVFSSFKSSNIIKSEILDEIDIAIVKGDTVKGVSKAIEMLGGIQKFLTPGQTVLLKPNASFPNPPEYGSTTDPLVLKSICEIVLEAGAKMVLVVDNTMTNSDLCFERNGTKKALEGLEQVKLISPKIESHYIEVPVPNGKAVKTVKIAKLLKRTGLIINVPCAKSHTATNVSFGFKNLMGLIWDRKYFHQGTDLHLAIAELGSVIRPHLTIIDATRALVTNGPTGPGKVQDLNTIIASTDPVAADAYATSIVNWNNRTYNPNSIQHLEHASKLGLGEINISKLITREESV